MLSKTRLSKPARGGSTTTLDAGDRAVLERLVAGAGEPVGELSPKHSAAHRRLLVRFVERHLEQTLPADARLRVGLVGIDTEARLAELEAWMRNRWELVECVHSVPTGVIGAHAGPGAWGCFYQQVTADDPLLD